MDFPYENSISKKEISCYSWAFFFLRVLNKKRDINWEEYNHHYFITNKFYI